MAILYLEEHRQCQARAQKKNSKIETINVVKNEKLELQSSKNRILFVMKGKLNFTLDKFSDEQILERRMLMIPSSSKFRGRAEEDSSIISIKFSSNIQLPECIAMEKLIFAKIPEYSCGIKTLDINEFLWNYLNTINQYISEGFLCSGLFELKVRELFYIMRGFYCKNDLFHFFYPSFDKDMGFSNFIYTNYHKVKTAQELAALSNYSFSGFQKRFKRVFSVSVYHWMLEKRSEKILQDIKHGQKPLKEISEEYGFSSPAHFNGFCKIHFGLTPGLIRKKNIKKRTFDSDFGENLEKIG